MDGGASEFAAVVPPPAAEVRLRERGELRSVKPLSLAGLSPACAGHRRPVFEWVRPAELKVDETYQRQLSEASVTLIRKIVSQWDWRRFKPPIVARLGEDLVVVDGQHTAIAAATHPEISEIPVMIVPADSLADQARAFVGHNRDRLNITIMQMHYAAVAAGDEDALTIDQVCQRAGVKVLRSPPAHGVYKPGDTVAVKAIGALISRRGAQKARVILQILAEARSAPVSAPLIKATEMLLHDEEYRGQVEPADLTSALLALGFVAEQEAKVFAAAHNVPLWRALGVVIFKRARRGRRRAD
jgi:hypothetical protein